MMITLLKDSLQQAFYQYQQQMSFYFAVYPWCGHHLPELEAGHQKKTENILDK